ncbi:unnamed protein product [Brassica oleracea var. botrytis]
MREIENALRNVCDVEARRYDYDKDNLRLEVGTCQTTMARKMQVIDDLMEGSHEPKSDS